LIIQTEGTYLRGRAEGEGVVGLEARRAVEKSCATRLIVSINVRVGAVGFEVGIESDARGRASLGSVV
jgi:hypothetical protein